MPIVRSSAPVSTRKPAPSVRAPVPVKTRRAAPEVEIPKSGAKRTAEPTRTPAPRVPAKRSAETTPVPAKRTPAKRVAEVVQAKRRAVADTFEAPAKRGRRAVQEEGSKKSVVSGLKPIREKLTQGELFDSITAELSETRYAVDRKQVKAVIDSFWSHVHRSLMPKGLGRFAYPGTLTIEAIDVPAKKVPARPAGEWNNPFKGGAVEWREAKPASVKPASVKVKAHALQKLKAAALGA